MASPQRGLCLSHQVFNLNAPVPPANEAEALNQANQYQNSYNPAFSGQSQHSVEQAEIQSDQLQSGRQILSISPVALVLHSFCGRQLMTRGVTFPLFHQWSVPSTPKTRPEATSNLLRRVQALADSPSTTAEACLVVDPEMPGASSMATEALPMDSEVSPHLHRIPICIIIPSHNLNRLIVVYFKRSCFIMSIIIGMFTSASVPSLTFQYLNNPKLQHK